MPVPPKMRTLDTATAYGLGPASRPRARRHPPGRGLDGPRTARIGSPAYGELVSFSRYAIGLGLLVAVAGSAAFGGARLRRRLLPRWRGAPARLAEAMIALGVVLGVAEVLAAIGLFHTIPFV